MFWPRISDWLVWRWVGECASLIASLRILQDHTLSPTEVSQVKLDFLLLAGEKGSDWSSRWFPSAHHIGRLSKKRVEEARREVHKLKTGGSRTQLSRGTVWSDSSRKWRVLIFSVHSLKERVIYCFLKILLEDVKDTYLGSRQCPVLGREHRDHNVCALMTYTQPQPCALSSATVTSWWYNSLAMGACIGGSSPIYVTIGIWNSEW